MREGKFRGLEERKSAVTPALKTAAAICQGTHIATVNFSGRKPGQTLFLGPHHPSLPRFPTGPNQLEARYRYTVHAGARSRLERSGEWVQEGGGSKTASTVHSSAPTLGFQLSEKLVSPEQGTNKFPSAPTCDQGDVCIIKLPSETTIH